MKKFTASALLAAGLTAGAFAIPATAAPVVEEPAETTPVSAAPTKEERLENAAVVSAELDNAKKGVETVKDIVDTLKGLKDFFGFNSLGGEK